MQEIYIKNMVCDRCIMTVRKLLEQVNAEVAHLSLGKVVLGKPLSNRQMQELTSELESVGLEMIDDRRSRIIEQIKNCIRELVHQKNSDLKINLSDYLSEHITFDYAYLASLFTESEGTTIEKYFIAQKIERVKELLVYDDLSLSEIAHQMNYSSVAHLSSQFKKVTGLTASYYKQMGDKRRQPLDKVLS